MNGEAEGIVTVALGDRVRPTEQALYKQLDGEAVLLHLESETYFGLNAVGARMWELLTTAPAIRDAFEALLEEYDVDPATLRKDMEDLIAELSARGLLRVEHP